MGDATAVQEKPPVGQESTAPKFHELDAPNNLESGQNFFDQSPFKETVTVVSKQTDITVPRVNNILRSLAQKGASSGPDTTGVTMTSQELSREAQNVYGKVVKDLLAQSEPGKVDNYRRAIALLANHLADFPYWHDYIVTQCIKIAGYRHDGSYIQGHYPNLPETYAKWASDRLKNDQRQKLLGLDDVAIVIPTTANRENRKWKILAASELIATRK